MPPATRTGYNVEAPRVECGCPECLLDIGEVPTPATASSRAFTPLLPGRLASGSLAAEFSPAGIWP